MRIAVLFDGEIIGQAPDLLIRETVKAVEVALAANGHDTFKVPVRPDGRWLERIRQGKFDLVFNLCEGINGVSALEASVISGLELLSVPFTGNASWTLALCLRKHVVNAALQRLGLPIPRFALVRPGDPMPSVGFPAICKPAAEDASLGVEQRSVVTSRRALAARVKAMHEMWPEILVQRFIDGREVNVGIVGDRTLPIAEIDFGGMPADKWRIVTFRSKWEVGSDEDIGTRPTCPANIPSRIVKSCEKVAVAAWQAVGGRGCGRVDMRIDAHGRPWILEVNPNPDFSPTAGLTRMAKAAGYDYAGLVRLLCEDALAKSQPVPERWELVQSLCGIASAKQA